MSRALLDAIKNDDAYVVIMTRAQARDIFDHISEDAEKGEELGDAIDNAQGEADAPGKKTYVIIEIEGASL